MIEQVKCYETSDGKLFKDKAEADEWEAELEWEKWYSQHKLYVLEPDGYNEQPVSSNILYGFLTEYKEDIIRLLNT